MNAALIVDGRQTALTPKEVRAALKAVLQARRGGLMRNRDLQAYEFSLKGYTDAEIGRMLGITATRVRNAIARVANGRYGEV